MSIHVWCKVGTNSFWSYILYGKDRRWINVFFLSLSEKNFYILCLSVLYRMNTFQSRPHPVALLASAWEIYFVLLLLFFFLCFSMSLSHSLFLHLSHGLSLLGINWVNEQVHKSLWRLCQTEASPALNKFAKVVKSVVVACVRAQCDKPHLGRTVIKENVN